MRNKEKSRICKIGRMLFLFIVLVDGLFLITDGYLNRHNSIKTPTSEQTAPIALFELQQENTTKASIITYDIFQEPFFKNAVTITVVAILILLIANLIVMKNRRFFTLNFKKNKEKSEAPALKTDSFKSVVENCSEPIVLFDMDGKITYCNPAFKKSVGIGEYNSTTIITNFIHSSDIEKFTSACANVNSLGEVTNIQFRLLSSNNSTKEIGAFITNMINNPYIKSYIANISSTNELHILNPESSAFETLTHKELDKIYEFN
jgi:PAS domain-containing protein